jgi:hypothetical protein
MIRGRHRGLPVAIDRAVLIPPEFSNATHEDGERTLSLHRLGSMAETSSGVEERGRKTTSAELRRRPSQRRYSGSEGVGGTGDGLAKGLTPGRPRGRSISFGVQNNA